MHEESIQGGNALASYTFRQFRSILAINNRVLEEIGRMESALAGEYIFDRKYLLDVVSRLIDTVREDIFCLNSLTENRFLSLYDRFEEISDRLQVLATGGEGPYDRCLSLPYTLANIDFEELIGSKNATLCEIKNNLHLPVPDGFAVTVAAFREFMEANNLFDRIDAIDSSLTSRQRAARITLLLAEASIPKSIRQAIDEDLQKLLASHGNQIRLAVRSSAVGEDGESRSFAGQFRSILDVAPDTASVLDAWLQVIASRFSPAALQYLGSEVDSRQVPMAAAVQIMTPARVAGVTYSRADSEDDKDLCLITSVRGQAAELVSGRTNADRFLVQRKWPFAPIRSRLADPGRREEESLKALDSGLRRGSASLLPDELKGLAETALLLEKVFGVPQDIEWALTDRMVILQSRPFSLPSKPAPLPDEIAAELKTAELLLEGQGHVAQLGTASGRVVHVDQDSDAEKFPVGAVAVARFPNPLLSPIVWRAAAIVTDTGGPTGHLATIAREYRTPALFGCGDACRLLPEGLEVTVDAENKKIYRGLITKLMQIKRGEGKPYRSEPELRTLRKLLRWIAPITLPDPTSRKFRPLSCQTFHDILRFCHEKAIDALIHSHGGDSDTTGMPSRPVQLPVPIKLHLIDLDMAEGDRPADTRAIPWQRIASRPLQAILQGMMTEKAWEKEPASLGFRDLLAGMTRPLSTLSAHPAFSGENLAIVAAEYCNLSLRLGYHFNVIDAFVSPRPDDNYIYFRFMGGMADRKKRDRRARLIAAILSGLYFKAERQGDLVVAKARALDDLRMEMVLRRLGELVAFTRQLDVQMRDEQAVEDFFQRFLQSVKNDWHGG